MTDLSGFVRAARLGLRIVWTGGAALAPLLWTGCSAPTAEVPTARVIAGGGRLLEPKPPQPRHGLVYYGPYDPRSGRASAELAARHGLQPYLPGASEEPATIFAADFDRQTTAAELDWLRVGAPTLRIESDGQGGRFLRMVGDDNKSFSGIAKHLYAAPFLGKTVACQVRTRWADRREPDGDSPRSETSEPSGENQPVVRFVTLVEGGGEVPVNWPVAWNPSPDWESQRVVWGVPDDILAVRLEVLLPRGAPAIELDDFLIYDPQALELAGPRPDPDRIPEPPRLGENLLGGGDFEVGQKGFGLLAYEGISPTARAVGTPWYIDHPGYVGDSCLAVPLNARRSVPTSQPAEVSSASEKVRCWFGPVVLDRPASYVVALAARATQSLPVEVALWIEGEEVGRGRLTVQESWRRQAYSFPVMGRYLPGEAYVVVEAARLAAKRPVGLWLDAVTLSPTLAPLEYRPPNLVELGVLGPADDPLDVGHLLDLGDPVEFKVRLVNYDRRAFVGQVCLDVLDALDRVVWTTDLLGKLGPRGYANDKLESRHRLHLGRGYYRILATAWLGKVGHGEPVSQAVRPFAVVNPNDPLPAGAPIGMPVAPGRYSQRMTQWGVGWARVALEGPEARANPVRIAELIQECHAQHLEVVGEYSMVGGTMPPSVSRHSIVPVSRLARLLGNSERARAERAWNKLVIRLGQNSNPLDQIALLAGGEAGDRNLAFEWRLPARPLPEDAEPQLQRLGQAISPEEGPRWWERGIHLAPTTNLLFGARVERVAESAGVMRRAPLDPVLEASELVRALAVRLWYGFERIALATYPFQASDPVTGAWGLHGSPAAAFCEYDHSPKPILGALDFAAEMLNDAAGVDWIDGWRQARALCFERPGDKGVTLLWRPLGTTASLHRLVGLGPLLARPGQPVADAIVVRNCFGQTEPCRILGQDLIVPISSMVLFISAEGQAWPQLRRALVAALAAPYETPAGD